MATETITARFRRERETKRTIRFEEIVENDATPSIGYLYVQKSVVAEMGSPDTVRVQVTAGSNGQ